MNPVSQVILSLLVLVPASNAVATRSPVQKVIELLEDNKVKISNDLAAEEKEMTEYADFCDTESSEKGYNIKTAISKIEDLKAIVEENTLKIPGLEDEVSTLGREVADKQNDLVEAKKVRDAERADFVAIEKDLVTSIDQLGKAAEIIGKASGGAFFTGWLCRGCNIHSTESHWQDLGCR